VQGADRGTTKTATIKKKKTTVDMFDVPSSQGTSPSLGVQRGRKRNRDWGGSHRGESEHKVVEEEEEEVDDEDERSSGDDDDDENGRGGDMVAAEEGSARGGFSSGIS
jgi:hypothetical protein